MFMHLFRSSTSFRLLLASRFIGLAMMCRVGRGSRVGRPARGRRAPVSPSNLPTLSTLILAFHEGALASHMPVPGMSSSQAQNELTE